MGARGPKPKPTSLRLLAGRRSLAGSGPAAQFAPGEPGMPKHLGKTARTVWKRTVTELTSAGVLSVADRDILAAYAVAVADLETLSARIDKDGLMMEVDSLNRNGEATGVKVLRPHPGLKWRQDLLTKVKQLAGELGLTPAARSRVSAPAETQTRPGNKVLEIRARIEAAREAHPPKAQEQSSS